MIEQVSRVDLAHSLSGWLTRMIPLTKSRWLWGAGPLLALLLAISQVQSAPQLQKADFDFSVYFTGNVRGNLEPCG